jgi:hypothetical protein
VVAALQLAMEAGDFGTEIEGQQAEMLCRMATAALLHAGAEA